MERYINEHKKEFWAGVTLGSPFQKDIFHEVKMAIQEGEYEQDYQWAFHCDIGSITVLDRRTGFGCRDIETGFMDKDRKFWLASGNQDVRESGCKTVGEAIDWIKKNANTCRVNHFEAFCQATPKNEHGYVPDLLDMGSDSIRDQATVAYLRDMNNYLAADMFHLYTDDMKGEYYRHLEIGMQDEVDRFNQKIDDAKEAVKDDHPYAIDSEYKYQHFNQAMFDAGMKPSDF